MSRLQTRVLRGWPAVGLVLMRVAVVGTIACRRPMAHVGELVAALLLLAGAWTPTVAVVIAVVEGWRTAFQSGGWVSLLLTTMALALALIGPDTYSLDDRFLGWRRIEIPTTRMRRRR